MKCGGVRVVSGVKRMNNAQGAGGREEMKPAQQTLSLLAHLIRADLLDPNLCSWIFLATSRCCTEHTNTHVKNGNNSMRSVFQVVTLDQCQFPGFDIVLELRKMSSWGKAGWRKHGTLCTVFTTSC